MIPIITALLDSTPLCNDTANMVLSFLKDDHSQEYWKAKFEASLECIYINGREDRYEDDLTEGYNDIMNEYYERYEDHVDVDDEFYDETLVSTYVGHSHRKDK